MKYHNEWTRKKEILLKPTKRVSIKRIKRESRNRKRMFTTGDVRKSHFIKNCWSSQSNNKLKQKRTRFSNWKVKSNSIRYVPDVKTYVARYISNINEKIVEKCRAPGKKTGSCAAAEACVCAEADDSPSVKRMGNFSQMLTGIYGGLVSRKEEEKSRLLVAESGGKSAAFVLVV